MTTMLWTVALVDPYRRSVTSIFVTEQGADAWISQVAKDRSPDYYVVTKRLVELQT